MNKKIKKRVDKLREVSPNLLEKFNDLDLYRLYESYSLCVYDVDWLEKSNENHISNMLLFRYVESNREDMEKGFESLHEWFSELDNKLERIKGAFL